jgi:PRTRC genetic system protein A
VKILAPFISCMLETSDVTVNGVSPLDQAINEGYSQIFLQTAEGFFKYHVLRPGEGGKRRFVCLQVKEIPGLVLPKVSPSVQFLPAGKIPMQLFEEVKEFFRQVIVKKGRALEAMIWVLWTEAQGYHLFVPNQTVGHASANYDWNSLPADSIIVVDIHSHADFNAFFSGTDDRDDQNCIRFSGVVGHNDKPVPTMEFRFNYLGARMKVTLEDLFEVQRPNVAVPEDWLDKVNTPTYGRGPNGQYQGYTPGQYTGGSYTPGAHNKYAGPLGQARFNEDLKNGRPNAGTPNQPSTMSSTLGGPIHGAARVEVTPSGGYISKKAQRRLDKIAARAEVLADRQRERQVSGRHTKTSASSATASKAPALSVVQEKGGAEEASRFPGSSCGLVRIGNSALVNQVTGEIIYQDEESSQEVNYEDLGPKAASIIQRTMTQEDDLDRMAAKHFAEAFGEVGEEIIGDHPEFDRIAINHGVSAAAAFVQIDTAGPELTQAPKILGEAITGLFDLLDESCQLSVFREMAASLSKKDMEDLATNGL